MKHEELHRSEKRSKGFSLMELLVTVSVMGFVLITLFSAFSAGVSIYKRIREDVGTRTKVFIACEKIEKDLRNVINFSGIEFIGEAKRLVMPGYVKKIEEDLPGGKSLFLGEISYYLDSSTGFLVKGEKPYGRVLLENYKEEINNANVDNAPDNMQSFTESVLGARRLVRIKDIEFKYYYYDAETKSYLWESSWTLVSESEKKIEEEDPALGEESEGEIVDESKDEDQEKFPLAVNISISYQDTGTREGRGEIKVLNRMVFIPIAVSKHGALIAELQKKGKETRDEES